MMWRMSAAPSARIISIAYAALSRLVVRMLARVRRPAELLQPALAMPAGSLPEPAAAPPVAPPAAAAPSCELLPPPVFRLVRVPADAAVVEASGTDCGLPKPAPMPPMSPAASPRDARPPVGQDIGKFRAASDCSDADSTTFRLGQRKMLTACSARCCRRRHCKQSPCLLL